MIFRVNDFQNPKFGPNPGLYARARARCVCVVNLTVERFQRFIFVGTTKMKIIVGVLLLF